MPIRIPPSSSPRAAAMSRRIATVASDPKIKSAIDVSRTGCSTTRTMTGGGC